MSKIDKLSGVLLKYDWLSSPKSMAGMGYSKNPRIKPRESLHKLRLTLMTSDTVTATTTVTTTVTAVLVAGISHKNFMAGS